MKKVTLIICCLLAVSSVFAQKDTDEKTNKNKTKPLARLDQADRVIVDIFTDIWMNAPDDSVMSISAINRGANAYFMRDIPIGKSNFSFAIGAGISCHNLYSDAWPVRESVIDTNTALGYVFTQRTAFQKLPDFVGATDVSYKNNKLTRVFIDVPIEFRFRTKNDGQKFKFALGIKAGYMLSSHTKYHGDDILYNYATTTTPASWIYNSEESVKIKSYKVPNLEVYRIAPTLRVGWGWVNITASYSLTHLFKKGKSDYDMYPISVGLSITPL
jgi:hypothetical protein